MPVLARRYDAGTRMPALQPGATTAALIASQDCYHSSYMRIRVALLLAIASCSMVSLGQSAAGNKPRPQVGDSGATAERVRQEFLHAWNGYEKSAWGHDELKPLSHTARDWHE